MENKEIIKLLLERDFEKLYQNEISIYDLSYIEVELEHAQLFNESEKESKEIKIALTRVPEYLKYFADREAEMEDLDFARECKERAEAEFKF